jgi:hypothetical protein
MLSRDYYRPIDRTQLVNKGVTPLTYPNRSRHECATPCPHLRFRPQ